MTELILSIAGLLAGTGLGYALGIRAENRRLGGEFEVDMEVIRDTFTQGAKAQAELGVILKKVPIAGASGRETGSGQDDAKPAIPRLKTDWQAPTKGMEHPSGPPPPTPGDFVTPEPRSFTDRLHTTTGP
jgi:hypothetical protein